jgi:two-component system sensor histidine kinase PilS (NtrC family)
MAPESDLRDKLKNLCLLRILFSLLLLGSAIILKNGRSLPPETISITILYGLIAFILGVTLAYMLWMRYTTRYLRLAYVQIGVDTLIVTVILFVTGGYSSLFSFLYVVVIVYSSLLLPRRGTVITAALCSIQFGLMVNLEYYGLANPFLPSDTPIAVTVVWEEILYKIVTLMAGCIVVAFLSSFLSEQTLRTRRELRIMEQHVKRVEKMAAIGEMAAGLAHEVKNPLASLTGAIQLLRDDIRYDPDHDRLMQIILREADRLSALVSNFLLYARPPMGKPVPLELEKALKETVELFGKRYIAEKKIVTGLRTQAGIWINIDPGHLRQVLWNLLVNAAEAINDSGRIQIDLDAVRDKQACLRIRDTGVGMNDETLRNIFDPFFTTKSSGTGLGLPIVQRIIEAYNGRLDVASEPDRGTTFSVYLQQIDNPAATLH